MVPLTWITPNPHLELLNVTSLNDALILHVKSTCSCASCPNCSMLSSRPHSCYMRKLQDLPISGIPVELVLLTRKWFCDNSA